MYLLHGFTVTNVPYSLNGNVTEKVTVTLNFLQHQGSPEIGSHITETLCRKVQLDTKMFTPMLTS